MECEIASQELDADQARAYLLKKQSEYKRQLSYGNYSLKQQEKINHTFEYLLSKYPQAKDVKKQESLDKHYDLECTLKDKHLKILVKCLEEAKLLKDDLSVEVLRKLFACELEKPLKVSRNKNRLLAYFLYQLDTMQYICSEWQSVYAKNELFLSSSGKNTLTQDDFSTNVNYVKEMPPKEHNIIDKYIDQLKQA